MEEIKTPELQSVEKPSVAVAVRAQSKKLSIVAKAREFVAKFEEYPKSKKFAIVGLGIVAFLGASVILALTYIQLSASARRFIYDGQLVGQGDGENGEQIVEPKPEDIKDQESPINGELYTMEEMREMEKRYPLAIVVENHTAARPQSGINKADIVYEMLAEGGITRFLPIYWGEQADEVGPVRSARKYMVDILGGYDAIFKHIGWAESTGDTNTDAAAYIYNTNTKSFLWGGYHWRSTDRVAPHNAYTSTLKLWEQAVDKGWGTKDSSLTAWKFKNDATLDDRPSTAIINLGFGRSSSASYDVKWVFDRDTNMYKRECGGKTDVDKVTGVQIEVKNIIAQEVEKSYPKLKDDKNRIILDIIGEGKATFFFDGKASEGTWEKSSRTSRTKYYDGEGNEVVLNRGKIWVELLPAKDGELDGALSYN